METNLNHIDLVLMSAIINPIQEDGWNIEVKSIHSKNSFSALLYNELEQVRVRFYIWNLTHDRGDTKPIDEYRIQITGVTRHEQLAGEKTLILGWWDEVGVFAGFDYEKHKGKLGSSPSFQIREEYLRQAIINGFAPCDKGNDEIAIAFRPDFILNYIQNLEQLHKFGASRKDFKALEQVATHPLIINSKALRTLTKQRQIVIAEVTKKLRDASFKARVLNAYGNKCAFSGLQLKLVDAAHILPVSADRSTDETANGIALSALYHRAYDRGLVTFNEKYKTIINVDKMNQLRDIGFDGGMDNFRKSIRPIINLPPAVNDRPNANFIIEANKLRGWT